MKIIAPSTGSWIVFLAAATGGAHGFTVRPEAPTSFRMDTSLNSIGLYYSTSTGNTETVAGYISTAVGVEAEEIGNVSGDEIMQHEAIIVGAPTWHTGADEQRSGTEWDQWLYSTLPKLDMTGKKVAIFGVGDQESYGDNFCDAAGELFDLFQARGAEMKYGHTSQEGYNHNESKAVRGDKFCGLMCDEDNQYDLSEDRVKNWVSQLKKEGFM
ncbi:flavodoxin [Nitzschia inconspicua]|uniref:Flavodoxin n=1 Tax=Nitzschia inconspicua TaxID=303405 RepID=A0A9K3Q5U0_9STRA|nr:flavodoxin [Nitzschia inconspicua]